MKDRVIPRDEYRICTYCIMDTSDPLIDFDKDGRCNHCTGYQVRSKLELHIGTSSKDQLAAIVEKIKRDGRNKDYDCIVGLSGGVDSTYVAYQASKLGLRPLAVHLDNGWDSELAVSNVEKTVTRLGIDLHSWVLDWEEFKDLHLAFLKSSVINSEIPTDHAIRAAVYHTATREGIRYILSGENIATEAILPLSWGYDARDWRHIKGIHNRFGTRSLTSYPHLTLLHWGYYFLIKGLKLLPLLSYLDYDDESAKDLLLQDLGWKDYGGKHYESIYTRFFQGYILPRKFNIDKRRAHLSTKICSGQISRDQALTDIDSNPYDLKLQQEDRNFVIKKLGLSEADFEDIMNMEPRDFSDYPNNHFWITNLRILSKLAKRRSAVTS